MVTTETSARQGEVTGEYRPGLPDRSIGRWIRGVAGVREPLLDWVPEERSRYTAMGLVICATGLMAGTSAFLALNNVASGGAVAACAVAALVWAVVIVILDRWLIISTHGQLEAKLQILGSRILVSLVMGTFIAEPLVVQFFFPAVTAEIQKMHEEDKNKERAQWGKCNPAEGAPSPTTGCDGHLLNLSGSPAALEKQRANLQTDLDTRKDEIDRINKAVAALQKKAREECSGKRTGESTGIPGIGYNCEQDRADAKAYTKDNDLVGKQKARDALAARISDLAQQIKNKQQTYAGEIKTEIDARVAAWSAMQNDRGLLDQVRALHRLGKKDWYVQSEQWLLRLLLITVDCAPVLTKLLSPNTTYDHLLNRQLQASLRMHESMLRVEEQRSRARNQVESRWIDHDRFRLTEEVDVRDRLARSERQQSLGREVDALAARLLARDVDRSAEDATPCR
ncbi:hypothetical protein GCM10017673_48480 [Streptosporangium violaceochromogenes]|nr:hypothetical protein GCM10017673_48480 [Streptosporangium violaceochromogenes]